MKTYNSITCLTFSDLFHYRENPLQEEPHQRCCHEETPAHQRVLQGECHQDLVDLQRLESSSWTFFHRFSGSQTATKPLPIHLATQSTGYHLNHQGEVLVVRSLEVAFVFTAVGSRRAVGSTPSLNKSLCICPTCGGVATFSVFWLRPHANWCECGWLDGLWMRVMKVLSSWPQPAASLVACGGG